MTAALLLFCVVLTVLVLLSMLLSFAVLRRLRDIEQRYASTNGMVELGSEVAAPMAEVGTKISAFHTTTWDGTPVGLDILDEGSLVGFFSADCDACHEQISPFLAVARVTSAPVLAVVVGAEGESTSLRRALQEQPVVVEQMGGPVTSAFGVQGFPSFALLDGQHRVTAQSYKVPALLT